MPENDPQNAPPAALDPVTGLHRMSATAGVGSTEYVAVNGAAITAAILGFASLLTLLGNALLVVPVAGVIVGAVALRQIRAAAGTQTGRTLAWAGLVLSLGLGGMVIGLQAVESQRAAADKRQIVALIGQLGQSIQAERWDDAYALFSPAFRQRVDKALFTERLAPFHSNPAYGKLTATSSNNLIDVQRAPVGGDPRAAAYLQFHFDKNPTPVDQLGQFRKSAEGWRIDNLGDVFRVEPPPGSRGGR